MKKLLLLLFFGMMMHATSLQAQVELAPDSNSNNISNPGYCVVYDGKLYFQGLDANNGYELCVYDGISSSVVHDIRQGGAGSYPTDLTVFDGKLYFNASEGVFDNELWVYNGQSDPEMINSINSSGRSDPNNLTVYDGRLYFSANDGNNGTELWAYDGVSSDPEIVKNIRSGNASSSPKYLTVFDDKLYFNARGSQGKELWVYDGVSDPDMVKDIYLGGSSSDPSFLTVYNGKLYFSATDGSTHGDELWVYDGVSDPEMVKDINSDGNSSPNNLKVYKDKLYFQANDGDNGAELWVYDGVSDPEMVKDLSAGSSFPKYLTVYNDKLYLRANNRLHGFPLCSEDANCAELSVIDCDGYTASSGQTYNSSGIYFDTLVGAAFRGLDSITFLTLDIQRSELSPNLLSDITLCTDDTLRQVAMTNQVAYMDFGGTNEYVNIDVLADDLVDSDRSVFMWIKKETPVSGEPQILFGVNSSTDNISNFQIGNNQELGIFDESTTHYTGVTVTDGQWHQVGYTYEDTSGETKIYIDGAMVLSFYDPQSSTTTSRFSLGQEYDGQSTGNFYDGLMTEVSVWKEVLSVDDIAAFSAAPIQSTHPQYANLVAYYPGWVACDAEVTDLVDFTANGNDGTATSENLISIDNYEQIPNFNSAAWFSKSWSSTNMGNNFSTADFIAEELTAVDDLTLVLNRDYIQVTENWTVDPQPSNQAKIVVKGNNQIIENGDLTPDLTDHTNFGDLILNDPVVNHTFTISNTGNAALDITNLMITGEDAADFMITSPPASSISPGGSTNLTIEFNPDEIGLNTAKVEFTTSDCNEANFSFDIKAAVLGVDVSEVRGRIATFNDTDVYVDIDVVADDMVGLNTFTLEAWVFLESGHAGKEAVVCINTSSSNRFLFFIDNGILETHDGNDTRNYGSTDLRGALHHVAVTFDGSNIRVYLDGVQQGGAESGDIGTFAADDRWSIGQEYDGSSSTTTSDFFGGDMDEVRIWKDVRTEQEIREHMHLTLESANFNSSADNLVAYYQFDNDGSGDGGVKDVMGNHGTKEEPISSSSLFYAESYVPVGKGQSATLTVDEASNYVFPNTGLEMTFTNAGGENLPGGDIVVSKITTEDPANCSVNSLANTSESYLVIQNYGTNNNLGVDVKIRFGDGGIADDIPANHIVHKRGSTEFDNLDWQDITPDVVSNTPGDKYIQAHVSSFSQFTVSSITSSLPVELLDFQARRISKGKVELKWTTASEINNKGFYIERSDNGRDGFEPISWQNGKGTTTSYSFYEDTDLNPASRTQYYRLKQIDEDGNFSYSDIRAVEGSKTDDWLVRIFPNPTDKDMKISFENLSADIQHAQIKIINSSNQVMAEISSAIEDRQVINLEMVSELAPSIYFVIIEFDNGERMVEKFVKK